ncbi:MAG: rluD [Gammaproteobacteria bacterium]|jgi:23S rRNA pseudouridine1911/1915/1917 synthase|nr:rluD [Gammaproteobacteria bacterium]
MKIQHTITIPDHLGGLRLDQALAKLLPDYSRTQIQAWLKNTEITLDGQPVKARYSVIGGEIISVCAMLSPQPTWDAQEIALNIIYEDDTLLVINKPVGMVVHPAAGHRDKTLLNAVLHHVPTLQELPRAGILHRLDKDTSGLLIIAKTYPALMNLTKQLKARTITRLYQAIVFGVLTSGGSIDQPIGRHPLKRKSMAVIETGKPALTHYRVIERYRAHTRIKVQLETGRTHQIRVHMAHVHHPLLGDPLYGGRLHLPRGATPELVQALRQFKRQALHAYELGLIHPATQKPLTCQAPLPEDMLELIQTLEKDARSLL